MTTKERFTPELIEEFNHILLEQDCSFKLAFVPLPEGDSNPSITIVPTNMKYINSYILHLTEEFYSYMEVFFKKRGISSISYNNDGSIFWSSKGW